MKRKQMAILLVLIAILVLLIIFAPAIKSSILVGTLVPCKMTVADVKRHMGSEGIPLRFTMGAYRGWYLPNGKFLYCSFNLYEVPIEEATGEDLLLEYFRVVDKPQESWVKKS